MEIKIDFEVLQTTNPEILPIADMSYWMQIENKPSIIEIKVPGTKKPVVNYFDKKDINYFNSINLNLKCPTCNDFDLVELPDGIYDITLKGSPSSFFKNRRHLRTVKLELKLAQLVINANMGCENEANKVYKDSIADISMLIDSAKANVLYDNLQTAHNQFTKAEEKINKLQNCKSC